MSFREHEYQTLDKMLFNLEDIVKELRGIKTILLKDTSTSHCANCDRILGNDQFAGPKSHYCMDCD